MSEARGKAETQVVWGVWL